MDWRWAAPSLEPEKYFPLDRKELVQQPHASLSPCHFMLPSHSFLHQVGVQVSHWSWVTEKFGKRKCSMRGFCIGVSLRYGMASSQSRQGSQDPSCAGSRYTDVNGALWGPAAKPSHRKHQKSNQKYYQSWQNKILALSDTDTTQIPHRAWQTMWEGAEGSGKDKFRAGVEEQRVLNRSELHVKLIENSGKLQGKKMTKK